MSIRPFFTVLFCGAVAAGANGAQPRQETSDRAPSASRAVRVEYRAAPVLPRPWRSGLVAQHHASTPGEAIARGLANLFVARAEARLLEAQARIATAEAVDRELDNRKKGIATGFEVRRMNREYRADERGPRPDADQLARYAASTRPARLSPSELDQATGELSWPVVLQTARYAVLRAELERFFARQAADMLEARDLLDVVETARQLLAELSHEVDQLRPADYIDARRFVESLAYAARQPAD